MQFKKSIFAVCFLCLLFLSFPPFDAEAYAESEYHYIQEKAAELDLNPSDDLKGKALSALLDMPLSSNERPVSVLELCVLLNDYLDNNDLVLPAVRNDSLPFDRREIKHWPEVETVYKGGLLGELKGVGDVLTTVSIGRGCLLVGQFLASVESANLENPVSTMVCKPDINVDSLASTLILGHSNVVGLRSFTDSPMDYCCRNAAAAYSFLTWDLHFNDDHQMRKAERALAEKQYEKVYLMLGTNDLKLGLPRIKTYEDSMREIIELIRSYQPNAKICLISITPVGFKPPLPITEQEPEVIRAFNQAEKTLSRDFEIDYLDIYSLLVNRNGYNRREYTRNDGVHYQKKGYELILNSMVTHPLR